ncbi:MAG: DUF805 domain-containing protein [Pseudomonadota bacterium]
MGIAGILFNPNGRITPNQFWRGIIVLVGLQIIFQVLANYGPAALAGIISLLGVLIVYPYLCVYGKRLHDAGKSAWWFLLFVLGYVILSIISLMLIPGLSEFFEEAMTFATDGDQAALDALTVEFGRRVMPQALAGMVLINGLLGFLVARLASDPGANEHGPPPGSDQLGETFT